MFAARLNASLSDNSVVSLLGYKRHYETQNTSGGLMRISSPADSIKAVTENEDSSSARNARMKPSADN